MSLLLAIFVLEDARVYICSIDGGNISSNIEISVDKHFCIFTALKIPNIYLDNCHVGFGRGLDNSWSESK